MTQDSWELGPAEGTLSVHTDATGPAARTGHRLTIEMREWSATVSRSDGMPTGLSASVVVESLTVVSGEGGVTPLTGPEKSIARGNALKSLNASKAPTITYDAATIDDAVGKATTWLQEQSGQIATGALAGASAVGSGLVTLVLVLILVFFFIKDGPQFLPFVRRVAGERAGGHLTEVATRSWNTLGGFIRTQALVSAVDAVIIGIGLAFLGVPLAFALAILTFFGGFIPIVGAFAVGFLSVLVALVADVVLDPGSALSVRAAALSGITGEVGTTGHRLTWTPWAALAVGALALLIAAFTLLGIGIGAAETVSNDLILSSAPPEKAGAASAGPRRSQVSSRCPAGRGRGPR